MFLVSGHSIYITELDYLEDIFFWLAFKLFSLVSHNINILNRAMLTSKNLTFSNEMSHLSIALPGGYTFLTRVQIVQFSSP